MRSITNIGYDDIQSLLRNRSLLFFAVILPLLCVWFFNRLLYPGVSQDLPVVVVDYDHSFTSRTLITNLDATSELSVAYLESSKRNAEVLVREGDVYGLIIIPKDFERNIRLKRPVQIINEFNGSLLLAGGVENRVVRKAVGTIGAGIQINTQLIQGKTLEQAKVNVQPVKLKTHILSNPYVNYSYYLNSGFLTLFLVIFVMLTTVYVFGVDLKYGKGQTLLKKANKSMLYVMLGKLWPATLWFYVLGLIIYYSMFIVQDFPLFGSKTVLLLALFLIILCSQALSVLLVATAISLRDALNKASAIAALSLAMSGFTFPISGMPRILQWLALFFPYTHFLDVFLDQTQRGFPVFYSLKAILILSLLTIAFFVFGALAYKKMLFRGAYATRV